MFKIPDFLIGATNVYRTRDYIVKQRIELRENDEHGSYLFSRDTYYRCTQRRNREYDAAFPNRVDDGERIHTLVYTRRYID